MYWRWMGGREKTVLWFPAPEEIASASRDVNGKLCIWTPVPNLRSRWPYWCDTFGDCASALHAMELRWNPRDWANRTQGERRSPQHLPSLDEMLSFIRDLEAIREAGY